MGSSAQSSLSPSGTSHGSSSALLPWLNQSWTSNCSHAAARTFKVVAGMNSLAASGAFG